ncbi:MAG: hypothetical protein ABI893_10570, partial [Polaromonas sp.]
MKDPISDDVRALWLRLREHGGWWTLRTLALHWRPTCEPHDVQQAVDILEARGFVESRHQASQLSYGITPDCNIPPGLEPGSGLQALDETAKHRVNDFPAARYETPEKRMPAALTRRLPHPNRYEFHSLRPQRNHMLLSSTGIKLSVHLRTHDGESVYVELENEDIEKAAMAKASVTEAEVHPIR